MKPSAPTADPRPADETDELLMGRVSRDADASAFTILVHRYEWELFVFLRRHLQCRELAEEAFQATFLQVHRHRGRFDAGRPFRPWIYAIAARQAIDAYRRDRRHRRPSLDASADGAAAPLVDSVAGRESTGDALVERAEARAAVRAAVERLPELLRRPLELVYQRGLRYREAAGVEVLQDTAGKTPVQHQGGAENGALLSDPLLAFIVKRWSSLTAAQKCAIMESAVGPASVPVPTSTPEIGQSAAP